MAAEQGFRRLGRFVLTAISTTESLRGVWTSINLVELLHVWAISSCQFERAQYSLGNGKLVTERSDSVSTQIISLRFVRKLLRSRNPISPHCPRTCSERNSAGDCPAFCKAATRRVLHRVGPGETAVVVWGSNPQPRVVFFPTVKSSWRLNSVLTA